MPGTIPETTLDWCLPAEVIMTTNERDDTGHYELVWSAGWAPVG